MNVLTKAGFLYLAFLAPAAVLAQTQTPAAAVTPLVQQSIFQAQTWAQNGNFDNAIMVLEYARRSLEASDFDRFKIDEQLQTNYTRLEGWSAAISAQERILSSPFFAASYRNPNDESFGRSYRLLEIARDNLRAGQFEAAEAAARTASKQLDRVPSPLTIGRNQEVEQILAAAQHHQSAVPPQSVPMRPTPPLPAEMVAAAVDTKPACAALRLHLNADTLPQVYIALASIDEATHLPIGNPIDLFGDGKLVYPVHSPGSSPSTEIAFVDTLGQLVATAKSFDDQWTAEFGGGELYLVRVAKRVAFLGHSESEDIYGLSGFGPEGIERPWCEFKVAAPPEVTQTKYIEISSLEMLTRAAQGKQMSLFRYVMTRPGLDAAMTVLESSRRSGDPIQLAPAPSDYDPAGESFLGAAVGMDRLDILQFLLAQGVDADLTNSREGLDANPNLRPGSPLDEAVKWNDLKAAQLLLEYGADPNYESWPNMTLARDAFTGHPPSTLEVLLNYGADPDRVPMDISGLALRKPDARDVYAKVELLLRHGADPDRWANVLFNEVAARSGLAPARVLAMRESNSPPAELTHFISVRTAWMDQLLSNPTRASDNGLEPLLREAIAMRDTIACPSNAPIELLILCLPGTMHHLLGQLAALEAGNSDPNGATLWRVNRNRECALKAVVPTDSSGWVSYVLGQPERAECVIRWTEARVAALSGRAK